MSRRLPDPLFKALEARLNLASLAALKAGYADLSRDYRQKTVSLAQREDLAEAAPNAQGGRVTGGFTRAQARALGYLAARFPATYAAVSEALRQVPDSSLALCESVLDLGAGPGTATWALAERWPGIRTARLLESNAEMIAHARALADGFPGVEVSLHSGDLADQLALSPAADLVLIAYVLNELDEGAQAALLKAAWEKAGRGILLVEPGTPETSRRLLAARSQWIALGGSMVAPCPQAGPCPMDSARVPVRETDSVRPWCHFSVRLERRGLHKSVKGGDLGYEDEKYSWVFLAKDPQARPAAPFRLHSDPKRVNRNITLDVCDADGTRRKLFYKRRETASALRHAARQRKWGDAWDPEAVDLNSGEDPEDDE